MYGLILAGGKSSRMGTEKALLDWHGQPLYQKQIALIRPFCKDVFVSVNQANAPLFQDSNPMPDNPILGDIGPLNGVLTAFDKYEGPWMVLGCDYPLLDAKDLEFLMSKRIPSQLATVFQNPETLKPEPLIGIYEKNANAALHEWYKTGNQSLRFFFEQNNIHGTPPPHPKHLVSMDTPEMYASLLKQP